MIWLLYDTPHSREKKCFSRVWILIIRSLVVTVNDKIEASFESILKRQKIIMKVSVEAIRDEYGDLDDPKHWHMEFTFALEFDIKYSFYVSEPYLLSAEEWQDMCDGKTDTYGFYQGNGEGYIDIDKNSIMEFCGAPSGAGGDVCGTFCILHDLVKDELQKAITHAREQGYFSE